jgi:hypothetical protein
MVVAGLAITEAPAQANHNGCNDFGNGTKAQHRVWSDGHEAVVCIYQNSLWRGYVRVCDAKADGHHAVARWKWTAPGGTVHTKRHYGGHGTCSVIHPNAATEHSYIYVKTCAGEGSTTYNCNPDTNGWIRITLWFT